MPEARDWEARGGSYSSIVPGSFLGLCHCLLCGVGCDVGIGGVVVVGGVLSLLILTVITMRFS